MILHSVELHEIGPEPFEYYAIGKLIGENDGLHIGMYNLDYLERVIQHVKLNTKPSEKIISIYLENSGVLKVVCENTAGLVAPIRDVEYSSLVVDV